ncbi:MAG: YlbF family regulator [Erysipelotrichaceae bacterium]|nr:YlbF family regulator [Erysipelotrichaceae bacterium]
METRTLRYLNDLGEAMREDQRTLDLRSAEQRLQQDEEAKTLLNKVKEARTAYLYARLEEGEESEKTKECLKVLHEAKLELDLCPAAKDYSRLFSEVNGLLRQIDAILFDSFREKSGCGGARD